ncbi:MAG: amidohydrolase family protein [Gemmatimonadota bacterium]
MRTSILAASAVLALSTPVGAVAQGTEGITIDVGFRNPDVSPDGGTLAIAALGSIWVLPVSGGEASQLTMGIGWDRHPAWSPDGRFLAYSHWSPSGTDLVVRTMESGLSRVIHHIPQEILQLDFDPAGEHVYFVVQSSQYDAHLWRIGLEGGTPEQLTATRNWHEWSFALSPSGEEALIETGRYRGTDLFLLKVGDRTVERITDTRERESGVAWSGDGERRAWVATYNGVDRIMVSTRGAPATEIARLAYGQTELTFTSQGSLLVSSARRLYTLDPEERTLEPLGVTAVVRRPVDPVDDLVIANVRVFDGVADALMEDAHVVVADGRIQSVGSGPVDAPAGVPVLDGRGRTLLPGLMDNHYHFWSPHAGADLLARGITAVRDPGVAIADGMDYKDAVALGLLAGPDIYSTGPLLDGPDGYHPMVDVSLDDPEAAAPLVRALKAQGVDALKAYFLLEPEVLAAVVAEAKIQGLPVTGHIGVRTSWSEAMDAGIDGFSHVRVWRDFLDPEAQPDGRDESLDAGRDPVARMQADWSAIDPDAPEVDVLIRRLAETGTALDPTLSVQRIDDDQRSRFSLEAFGRARQSFERMKVFVRKAVEAGVPLLAGTDNLLLHEELETYASAGVPNATILEAASVNGARWLGRDDFGTVEVGKRANLILVDGDPLDDIAVLREVDLVLKDGVVVFRRGR